jgi:hypothetical protein
VQKMYFVTILLRGLAYTAVKSTGGFRPLSVVLLIL